ncbi:hypothetical protein GCM10008022_02830 [Paenibacillus hunanensis]|nr:hypothetical protein GCM10008022_02830 [Paenibacillus hunanensis]
MNQHSAYWQGVDTDVQAIERHYGKTSYEAIHVNYNDVRMRKRSGM